LQQAMLEPQQDAIDLGGGQLGLPGLDLADLESVPLAAVAEEDPVAAVSLLKACHDFLRKSFRRTLGAEKWRLYYSGNTRE
jgi:hypothetical protein